MKPVYLFHRDAKAQALKTALLLKGSRHLILQVLRESLMTLVDDRKEDAFNMVELPVEAFLPVQPLTDSDFTGMFGKPGWNPGFDGDMPWQLANPTADMSDEQKLKYLDEQSKKQQFIDAVKIKATKLPPEVPGLFAGCNTVMDKIIRCEEYLEQLNAELLMANRIYGDIGCSKQDVMNAMFGDIRAELETLQLHSGELAKARQESYEVPQVMIGYNMPDWACKAVAASNYESDVEIKIARTIALENYSFADVDEVSAEGRVMVAKVHNVDEVKQEIAARQEKILIVKQHLEVLMNDYSLMLQLAKERKAIYDDHRGIAHWFFMELSLRECRDKPCAEEARATGVVDAPQDFGKTPSATEEKTDGDPADTAEQQ